MVVYTDAGAADALNAHRAARLLRSAGHPEIQGFFLNATHFDWTRKEIRYGDKISRMTGHRHFVVNTAMNGRGPIRPQRPASRSGNEDSAIRPARGLGPLPTFETGFRRVDAFAWIATGPLERLRQGRAADRPLLGRAGAVARASRELQGSLTAARAMARAVASRASAARARDRAPADDQVAVHQARELPRRGAVDRLVEVDGQLPVTAGGRDRRRASPAAGASDSAA